MVISSHTHIHCDIAKATISRVHDSLNPPLSSGKRSTNPAVSPNPLLIPLCSSFYVKNLLPGALAWEVVSRTVMCLSLIEASDYTSYHYHFLVVIVSFSINSLHWS